MNLNEVLSRPDGSINNLDISTYLDTIPLKDRGDALLSLLKKVKYDHYIEITGLDIDEAAQAFYVGYIDHAQYNDLLYNGRQSSLSSHIVAEQLKSYGFKVINQRISQYMYYIKAQRCLPQPQPTE